MPTDRQNITPVASTRTPRQEALATYLSWVVRDMVQSGAVRARQDPQQLLSAVFDEARKDIAKEWTTILREMGRGLAEAGAKAIFERLFAPSPR